jgi:hypothetical protein
MSPFPANAASHRESLPARNKTARSKKKGKKMTLPLGNWDIDGNGFRGTLTINGVDAAGNLNASVVFESPEAQQAIGFWDEASQKITFVRVINQDDRQRTRSTLVSASTTSGTT